MFVHGISPETIVSIPKCKRKMMCCSDNYKAITLSGVLEKIVDSVILLKEQTILNSSDIQFVSRPMFLQLTVLLN